MKRATITISDQLQPALEAYLKDQEVAPSLTRLLQTALGEFLSARGYGKKAPRAAASFRTAAITPSTPQPGPRPTPEPAPTPQPRAAEVEVARPVPPDKPVPPDEPMPRDEDETDTALL